jgi:hypothetical protein
LEKEKVFVLEHGFIVDYDDYVELKKIVREEVNALIASVGYDPKRLKYEFQHQRNVADLATFPRFTKEIVKHLVPEKLRHLLYNNQHTFGKKPFCVKLFDAIRGELVYTSSCLECIAFEFRNKHIECVIRVICTSLLKFV